MEYSILALRHLGRGAMESSTVREIALACQIPQSLLAKLLQQLARKGMVQSVQGVNGGYRLKVGMAEITLADLYDAVEGPFRITACRGVGDNCDRFENCDLKSAIAPLQRQLHTYLRTVSLADLELEIRENKRQS